MAGAPTWKVYDAAGTYQAACKEAEAAACLVSWYGSGATIRYGHRLVVWREGRPSEGVADGDGVADDSYDYTAQLVHDRATAIDNRTYRRQLAQAR